jgi:hypothetical protein
MQKKTYSKEEFQAMVAELESEFMNLLKSEQESAQLLAKSEEKEEEAKEEKKEESKEEPKAEAKESEEKKDEPKAEDKKDEDKKEEEKKDEEESHDYDEEDMEEMQKMYSSMSKGELKAHKDVVEKCYMAKCGEMTQMKKSEEASKEVKDKSSSTSSEESLLKSELEAIKKENEELKKNIEGLVSAINTFVNKKQAPARKAITDIRFVKKSEEEGQEKPLTKSEIHAILAKKARDPKTSSQDRAAINEFYLTNGSVEKIAHLLKQ